MEDQDVYKKCETSATSAKCFTVQVSLNICFVKNLVRYLTQTEYLWIQGIKERITERNSQINITPTNIIPIFFNNTHSLLLLLTAYVSQISDKYFVNVRAWNTCWLTDNVRPRWPFFWQSFSWLVILIGSSAWLSNKIYDWNNKFSQFK